MTFLSSNPPVDETPAETQTEAQPAEQPVAEQAAVADEAPKRAVRQRTDDE